MANSYEIMNVNQRMNLVEFKIDSYSLRICLIKFSAYPGTLHGQSRTLHEASKAWYHRGAADEAASGRRKDLSQTGENFTTFWVSATHWIWLTFPMNCVLFNYIKSSLSDTFVVRFRNVKSWRRRVSSVLKLRRSSRNTPSALRKCKPKWRGEWLSRMAVIW